MSTEQEKPQFAYINSKMFEKIFIPSQHIKNKEKEVYIIEYEGVTIEVLATSNLDEPLLLYIDGEQKAQISKENRIEIQFSAFNKIHKIKVWNGRAKNFFFTNFIFHEGIAITIDEIPVKNTLSDPIRNLKEGKVAIYIFLGLIVLGAIIVQLIKFPNGLQDTTITMITYGTLSILLLYAILIYSKSPRTALWIGLIIGSIETFDFIYSFFAMHGKNFFSFFFGGSIRTGSLYAMYRSLKAINAILRRVEIKNTAEMLENRKVENTNKQRRNSGLSIALSDKIFSSAKWIWGKKKFVFYLCLIVVVIFGTITLMEFMNEPKIDRDISLKTTKNILLPDLIPYRKINKWGFCNKEKKIIIEPIYDDVKFYNFPVDRAAVKFNGLWGLIDKSGNKITRFIYDDIDFRENRNSYDVRRKGAYSPDIDANGNLINEVESNTDIKILNKLESIYGSNYHARRFGGEYKDYFIISKESLGGHELWGLIDSSGSLIVPIEYFIIEPLIGGFFPNKQNLPKTNLIRVEKFIDDRELESRYGIMDFQGNLIIPIKYMQIYGNLKNDNLFIVQNEEFKWGVINKFDDVLIPFNYSVLGTWIFKGTEAFIDARNDSGYFGVINEFGEVTIPFIYENPRVGIFLYQNFCVVKKNNKYGLVDYFNKKIKSFNYDYIGHFKEGYARVKVFDQKKKKELLESEFSIPEDRLMQLRYFLIKTRGFLEKYEIPSEYETLAKDFDDSASRKQIYENIKPYLLGYNLERDDIYSLEDNSFLDAYTYEEFLLKMRFGNKFKCWDNYIDSLTGKWGFIDEKGKEIIPLIYDDASDFEDGLAKVKINGKWGMINKNGQVVIPIKYDKIEGKLDNYDLIEVKINGRKGYVDMNGVEYFE